LASFPTISWILDSGGAGRGAWQGGVIHQLMHWMRLHETYPLISMGASAGAYAAADVATETEVTVMRGWTRWGARLENPACAIPREHRSFWGLGEFRLHLRESIRYVMEPKTVETVFNNRPGKKLLLFTTRIKRKDGRKISARDLFKYFLKSTTRKLPVPVKYLPRDFEEDPVIFAAPLPSHLHSEFVRPLTSWNYHRVIEASCLVPVAMGWPLQPDELLPAADHDPWAAQDKTAVFLDGGFSLKMPMARFEEDARFHEVSRWAKADKTMIFCCDPKGQLWETSSRLRLLNDNPAIREAICNKELLVIHPDHVVEAGFLCHDNHTVMRTFQRGQAQGDHLLKSDLFQRFLGL